MNDFSELPASERARRYRQLAEDALREAEQADGSVRESYLLIAEQWNRLAQVDADHSDISRVS
jgi:thymidylate kinase